MSKLEDFVSKDVPLWCGVLIVIVVLEFLLFTGLWGLRLLKNVHRIDKSNDLVCKEQRFPGESGFAYAYAPGARKNSPYLLLNRYDGDRKQSVSELIDLNTQEKIHTWAMDVNPVWDTVDYKSKFTDLKRDAPTDRFRNIHTLLFKDGSVVFTPISNSLLLKFNKAGKLVWVSEHHFHHTTELDHEGNIWAPSTIVPSSMDNGNDYKATFKSNINFADDALTKLSPEGNIRYLKSVAHLLVENGLGHLIYGRGTNFRDPIHLNDIQPALKDGEYWKKGDLFISMRNQSMVLLYRPFTNKILWYSLGPWIHQHDVDIISDHEIGVFNNNAITKGKFMEVDAFEVDGFNQYLVYNFVTKKFSTPFDKGFEKLEIRTTTQGLGELYSHNKLFVEETNYGRLIVFDKKGEVEWQYINRAKDGKVYLLNWSRLVPRNVGDEVRKLVNK